MADEGLSLRDVKRQERLEKRGGALGKMPPRFWEKVGELRRQLRESLKACGPEQTTRYVDLLDDLKRLEGLLREITVTRERKLLLAAHEAVSGLSPSLRQLEEREKPLFDDLKQVLSSHRQRVFTGPAVDQQPEAQLSAQTEMPPPRAVTGEPKPEADREAAPGQKPTQPTPPAEEITPPVAEQPTGAFKEAGADKIAAVEEGVKSSAEPGEPDEQGRGKPTPESYRTVRVLEDIQPFTAIDARVYTLKAQDVVSLPEFNAKRLTEVGVVAPIGGKSKTKAPKEK